MRRKVNRPIMTTNSLPLNDQRLLHRQLLSSMLREVGQQVAGQISATLSLLGSRTGNQAGILTYHRIADLVPSIPKPSLNVSPRSFRRQLQGMVERGYVFRSLSWLLRQHRIGRELPAKVVVVTFDDGYAGVYDYAFPILVELGIPATVFLNTAYLDADQPFPFDDWGTAHWQKAPGSAWRPLSTAQCREMLASGMIELGAHTHTHDDFRNRPSELEADLRMNVSQLRERFELSEVTFAFPFGRWRHGYVSDELLAAVRRVDVCCALTTECEMIRPSSDPFGWGRFNVYDFDTARTIAGRLRGWYSWAPRSQDFIVTACGLGRAMRGPPR